MTDNKIELVLAKYRKLVALDSMRARKVIKSIEYKNNFYLLKCIAQTYLDESRFEDNSGELREFVNFRKWRLAEKYIILAFEKKPDNAEVLYTMGEVRKLNHQNEIAIHCFKKIIKTGVGSISKQEYSRGIKFAKELINDSKFELYRLFFQSNTELSKKYLKSYRLGLKKGVSTIFSPLSDFLI